MRTTPLAHDSSLSVSAAARTIMRKFFGKKRLSRSVPEALPPLPPPPQLPPPPALAFATAPHGVQGASPPNHAPPNASGYVNSYALHGGVAGNLHFAPARAAAAFPSSTGYGGVYRSPRSEYCGAPPAHHINDTTGGFDAHREELFASAPQRTALHSPAHGAYGTSGLQEQHMATEEEEEEEDVEAIKSEIRFTKRQTVASTQTALRAAADAEESGRSTLVRLGAQGDSLQNTRKNLALASSHNRVAADKTRELKKANGSMFAVHVNNPLRRSARAAAEDAEVLALRQEERVGREELSVDAAESRSRVGRALNDASGRVESRAKISLAERARFQFEADESDDEMEREIGTNLELIADASGRLKGLAIATGKEVERQVGMVQDIRIEVIGAFVFYSTLFRVVTDGQTE